MVDWDVVRELGGTLPGVEEGTSWGTPALKVKGRMFVRLRPEVDDPVIVVRVEPQERDFLLQSEPDTFFVTPHYDGHPAVLVRLGSIGREDLCELLTESWLFTAPTKLVREFGVSESAP